jgi:hypothetical protein
MKNDAIVTDVSTEEVVSADEQKQQETQTTREPTEREKRIKELSQEHAKLNGYPETEAEQKEQVKQEVQKTEVLPEVDEAVQPEATPDPLKDLGYYRNPKGQLVTKMKVNGQEVEVTADQMKAYIQKDIAGDRRRLKCS